jgi:LPXTG-motif cell wall-anchored protein
MQPVLPVTGYDAAVKLAALSMVLIGGGALTVRASRRQ